MTRKIDTKTGLIIISMLALALVSYAVFAVGQINTDAQVALAAQEKIFGK